MTILQTLAALKFRSQIDLSDAYFQVWIHLEHEHLTAFKTPFGMFNSRVMQQGDCNAPTTFSRLISHVLHEYLGRFRSEERRVGKECRSWWTSYNEKQKQSN